MEDRKSAILAILGPEKSGPGDEGPDELEAIAQELIEAVHARNPQEVKDSLRAAFECMEAEPHEEGPHEGESEDYEG